MATDNPDIGHQLSPLAGTKLVPTPAAPSRRVAENCPSPSFDASLTYSSDNDHHHAHGDAYAKSATGNSNININSSNSTGNSASPVQDVIGADPCVFGNNGQACRGGNYGEDKGECDSAETSYVEGFTEELEGIFVDAGPGMDTVIGKRTANGAEEIMTVGSTVALVHGAQAAMKEQIASMQRQELVLGEAKAALRTIAGWLSTSEEDKQRLAFANDELSVKIMVMEEEAEEVRTRSGDDSSQIRELTLRAEQVEAAKARLGSENASLRASVSEEKHNNRAMRAEIALLKATLAKRSDAEASEFEDGCKATPASTAATAQDQATAAAAETPRSATRRPLAAVDPNSERKCGNGGKSPHSLAYQSASRDCQGTRTPVAKLPVPPSLDSFRRKAEVSPSIVYSPLSTASFERDCSIAPAPLKVDSPEGNNVSSLRDYRNDSSSSKVESPVQQTAPAPRRYSARIAAKAGGGTAPPPRRFSARIAAKTSRDSIATGRGGVATRRSKRVEDQSPLSSLRVTRSTFRAAENAAIAADKRLTSEPKVKDRKRFMRF